MKNIKLSVILVLLWVSAAAQDNEPSIQFGLVADIQYAHCEPQGSRYYSNSLHKIQEAVNYFNAQNVLFTINLGDIVDRNFSDIDSILPILNQLKNPIYHITGNHDYKGVSNNDALYAKLSMPSGYYSFSIKNWTFIMLNTNEVASYSNIAGTHMEQELSAMMDNIKTTGKRQGQPYNGGISQRQLAWLSGMLQNAQNNAMNVLIFAHHPLYPEYAYNALNNTEILSVIGSYDCVKAIFAGHDHDGNFAYYRDIPVITAEGMIETPTDNAFGIVKLYDRKLVIEGHGRMTQREIKIKR